MVTVTFARVIMRFADVNKRLASFVVIFASGGLENNDCNNEKHLREGLYSVHS
jgi:hypothetical protein